MRRFGWVVLDERENFLQLTSTRQIGWCRREENATLFAHSPGSVIEQLEARYPDRSFYHMPLAQGKMEPSQLLDATGGLVH